MRFLSLTEVIALESDDVIGFLVDDLSGDATLLPHGVDGDDGTFDRHHVQSAGMATMSLDFSVTAICPSTRRWRAAKAETR